MNRTCTLFAGLVSGALAFSAAADPALAPLMIGIDAEPDVLFSAAPIGQDEAIVALSAMQDEAPAPAPAWKGKFFFGLGGASGNSENLSGTLNVGLKRESERNRTQLNGDFYYGTTDGDKDQNRLTLAARHDWLVPGSPWFYFAQGVFDIDEFQSWDERVALHGGVGYELVNRENYKLNLRAGLGAIREWGSTNDDWRLEGLLGFDLVWDITDKQQFVAGSTYYPDFDESGEFRMINYAGWSAKIDDSSGMSLNARVEHEHQSRVEPGRDRNDIRFALGLSFDF